MQHNSNLINKKFIKKKRKFQQMDILDFKWINNNKNIKSEKKEGLQNKHLITILMKILKRIRQIIKNLYSKQSRRKSPHQKNYLQYNQESSSVYEGEWKNGMRDGYRIQKWIDGSIYQGKWLEDKFSGRGKLIHADGDVYDGEWKNNKSHGKGTYTCKKGTKYEGEIRIIFYFQYKGQYFEGKKHGKGIENLVMVQDMKVNSFKITYLEKEPIFGQTIEFTKDDGKIIICMEKVFMNGLMVVNILEYEDNQKNGKGVFEWPNSRTYIGFWIQGKQHGIGIYFQYRKQAIVGEWNDGERTKWFDKNEIEQLVKEQKIDIEDLHQYD